MSTKTNEVEFFHGVANAIPPSLILWALIIGAMVVLIAQCPPVVEPAFAALNEIGGGS